MSWMNYSVILFYDDVAVSSFFFYCMIMKVKINKMFDTVIVAVMSDTVSITNTIAEKC